MVLKLFYPIGTNEINIYNFLEHIFYLFLKEKTIFCAVIFGHLIQRIFSTNVLCHVFDIKGFVSW